MKKLAMLMILAGCASSKSADLCSNWCLASAGTSDTLFAENSACLCSTDYGLRAKLGLCVANTKTEEEFQRCLAATIESCKDPKILKQDPDGICKALTPD
jgi:hypothetical protein